jgi:hypothetical protein
MCVMLTLSRFTGPKVNIEHMMLGRDGNLIDGRVQPKDGDGRGSSEGSSGGEDALKLKAEEDGKNANLA